MHWYNAWLDENHQLPPEFVILGFKPEPWQPADSLVWAKMMAWDLGGNWTHELMRMRLQQLAGRIAVEHLAGSS